MFFLLVKIFEEGDFNGNFEVSVLCDVVKGLLGCGKFWVVFGLKLEMESVWIFVNKEDGF